ncbi:hypothetical protein M8J77_008554 [Diaphorina citri]|nr:hypothetical protein M8J77_008554 [Diaphorina citri]
MTDDIGKIVLIKKNGKDGSFLPLPSNSKQDIVIGKSATADIRIKTDGIQDQHCSVSYNGYKAIIRNLAKAVTFVNNISIKGQQTVLKHNDLIRVGEREFRWEYLNDSVTSVPGSRKSEPALKLNSTSVNKSMVLPSPVFKRRSLMLKKHTGSVPKSNKSSDPLRKVNKTPGLNSSHLNLTSKLKNPNILRVIKQGFLPSPSPDVGGEVNKVSGVLSPNKKTIYSPAARVSSANGKSAKSPRSAASKSGSPQGSKSAGHPSTGSGKRQTQESPKLSKAKRKLNLNESNGDLSTLSLLPDSPNTNSVEFFSISNDSASSLYEDSVCSPSAVFHSTALLGNPHSTTLPAPSGSKSRSSRSLNASTPRPNRSLSLSVKNTWPKKSRTSSVKSSASKRRPSRSPEFESTLTFWENLGESESLSRGGTTLSESTLGSPRGKLSRPAISDSTASSPRGKSARATNSLSPVTEVGSPNSLSLLSVSSAQFSPGASPGKSPAGRQSSRALNGTGVSSRSQAMDRSSVYGSVTPGSKVGTPANKTSTPSKTNTPANKTSTPANKTNTPNKSSTSTSNTSSPANSSFYTPQPVANGTLVRESSAIFTPYTCNLSPYSASGTPQGFNAGRKGQDSPIVVYNMVTAEEIQEALSKAAQSQEASPVKGSPRKATPKVTPAKATPKTASKNATPDITSANSETAPPASFESTSASKNATPASSRKSTPASSRKTTPKASSVKKATPKATPAKSPKDTPKSPKATPKSTPASSKKSTPAKSKASPAASKKVTPKATTAKTPKRPSLTVTPGKKSPASAKKTPAKAIRTPAKVKNTPATKKTPAKASPKLSSSKSKTPASASKSPKSAIKTPKSASKATPKSASKTSSASKTPKSASKTTPKSASKGSKTPASSKVAPPSASKGSTGKATPQSARKGTSKVSLDISDVGTSFTSSRKSTSPLVVYNLVTPDELEVAQHIASPICSLKGPTPSSSAKTNKTFSGSRKTTSPLVVYNLVTPDELEDVAHELEEVAHELDPLAHTEAPRKSQKSPRSPSAAHLSLLNASRKDSPLVVVNLVTPDEVEDVAHNLEEVSHVLEETSVPSPRKSVRTPAAGISLLNASRKDSPLVVYNLVTPAQLPKTVEVSGSVTAAKTPAGRTPRGGKTPSSATSSTVSAASFAKSKTPDIVLKAIGSAGSTRASSRKATPKGLTPKSTAKSASKATSANRTRASVVKKSLKFTGVDDSPSGGNVTNVSRRVSTPGPRASAAKFEDSVVLINSTRAKKRKLAETIDLGDAEPSEFQSLDLSLSRLPKGSLSALTFNSPPDITGLRKSSFRQSGPLSPRFATPFPGKKSTRVSFDPKLRTSTKARPSTLQTVYEKRHSFGSDSSLNYSDVSELGRKRLGFSSTPMPSRSKDSLTSILKSPQDLSGSETSLRFNSNLAVSSFFDQTSQQITTDVFVSPLLSESKSPGRLSKSPARLSKSPASLSKSSRSLNKSPGEESFTLSRRKSALTSPAISQSPSSEDSFSLSRRHSVPPTSGSPDLQNSVIHSTSSSPRSAGKRSKLSVSRSKTLSSTSKLSVSRSKTKSPSSTAKLFSVSRSKTKSPRGDLYSLDTLSASTGSGGSAHSSPRQSVNLGQYRNFLYNQSPNQGYTNVTGVGDLFDTPTQSPTVTTTVKLEARSRKEAQVQLSPAVTRGTRKAVPAKSPKRGKRNAPAPESPVPAKKGRQAKTTLTGKTPSTTVSPKARRTRAKAVQSPVKAASPVVKKTRAAAPAPAEEIPKKASKRGRAVTPVKVTPKVTRTRAKVASPVTAEPTPAKRAKKESARKKTATPSVTPVKTRRGRKTETVPVSEEVTVKSTSRSSKRTESAPKESAKKSTKAPTPVKPTKAVKSKASTAKEITPVQSPAPRGRVTRGKAASKVTPKSAKATPVKATKTARVKAVTLLPSPSPVKSSRPRRATAVAESPKPSKATKKSATPVVKSPKPTRGTKKSVAPVEKFPKPTRGTKKSVVPVEKSPKPTRGAKKSVVVVEKPPKPTRGTKKSVAAVEKSPKPVRGTKKSAPPVAKSPKPTRAAKKSPAESQPKVQTKAAKKTSVPAEPKTARTSKAANTKVQTQPTAKKTVTVSKKNTKEVGTAGKRPSLVVKKTASPKNLRPKRGGRK